MKRALESVEEMTQALAVERGNSSRKQLLYRNADGNPGKNAQALANIVGGRISTIETIDGRTKIDWDDLPTIRARVCGYLEACAAGGTIPTVQGVAVHALGISKRRLNAYMTSHSGPTVEFLECVKDELADILVTASLGNRVNVVAAIFALKNNHAFRDTVELQAGPAPSIASEIDPAELQRQLEALPDD